MSTTSANLLLTLLSLGESAVGGFTNWGDSAVDNFSNLESAITDTTAKTVTTANVTLTDLEARSLVIRLTGAMTGPRAVIMPLRKRMYYIDNQTTGGFFLNVRGVTGTAVALQNGQGMFVYCDGVNFTQASGWIVVNNSDGTSLRSPSGIQICLARFTFSNLSTTNKPGGADCYTSDNRTWNYPQAFKTASTPFVIANAESIGSISGGTRWGSVAYPVSPESSVLYKVVGVANSGTPSPVNLFAIGFWR